MSLATAQEKYARNTATKAAKWYQRTTQAGASAYCQGIAQKLGINVAGCMSGPGANFQAGVQAAGAQSYAQGVEAKAGKWAQNFAQAMGG